MLANLSDPLLPGYTVERGDVLMWLEMTLYAERQEGANGREAMETTTVTSSPAPVTSSPAPVAARSLGGQASPAMAADHPNRRAADRARGPQNPRSAKPIPHELTDPATGAGTAKALQRDLILNLFWPVGGPGFVLLALNVRPTPGPDGVVHPAAGEAIMSAVVDTVPFVLRAKDRVYRLGPDDLALMLTDTDPRGAPAAMARLQKAMREVASVRRLPPGRLKVRRLDPRAMANAEAAPPPELPSVPVEPATPPAA